MSADDGKEQISVDEDGFVSVEIADGAAGEADARRRRLILAPKTRNNY